MSERIALGDYVALRNDVLRFLGEGKARIECVVTEEILRTYHEIGRALDTYLSATGERSGYGEQTVVRLAEDVGVGKTALYQALRFYRLNPKFQSHGKLTWTHYCSLLALPTVDAQRLYETAAIENGWSVRELEAQIRLGVVEADGERIAPRLSPDLNLPALRGEFYTYRLLNNPNGSETDLLVDLGFGIRSVYPMTGLVDLRAGQRVRVMRDGNGGFGCVPAEDRSASFYTYWAKVLDVVDGDTLWLAIDCGFYVWTEQKVRLRGIDTPELPTAEGRRAKDFVIGAIGNAPFVVVTTTKPDKYDRYLADVFVGKVQDDKETVLRAGTFLNREAVARGFARRFREGTD